MISWRLILWLQTLLRHKAMWWSIVKLWWCCWIDVCLVISLHLGIFSRYSIMRSKLRIRRIWGRIFCKVRGFWVENSSYFYWLRLPRKCIVCCPITNKNSLISSWLKSMMWMMANFDRLGFLFSMISTESYLWKIQSNF